MLEIRKAKEADFEDIWRIFHQVAAKGDTYAFDPETSRKDALEIWTQKPWTPYVALDNRKVVGTFKLGPNMPDLGDHVANAGFMVDPARRKKGVGRAMGEFALKEAARLGYLAMQFNFVVSTNKAAVKLWLDLGFKVMATLPKAFRHREKGLVAIHVMYKELF
jgi:GNAT superfamily N-acetyltransferase